MFHFSCAVWHSATEREREGERRSSDRCENNLLPPCLTGLRCHGNMLWRSSYWDSDESQATGFPVRGFAAPTDEERQRGREREEGVSESGWSLAA